jgi:hypothetical protein
VRRVEPLGVEEIIGARIRSIGGRPHLCRNEDPASLVLAGSEQYSHHMTGRAASLHKSRARITSPILNPICKRVRQTSVR